MRSEGGPAARTYAYWQSSAQSIIRECTHPLYQEIAWHSVVRQGKHPEQIFSNTLRLDESLAKTRGSKWFTKLDLQNGYYLVCISGGEEPKTAFSTGEELFEHTVVSLGLNVALVSFQ